MKFCKFVESVKAEMERLCGKEWAITIQTILKNNGTKQVGMSVTKKGKNSSPIVYLEPYYESYTAGKMSISLVTKDIHNIFTARQFTEIPEMELGEFEKMMANQEAAMGDALYREGLHDGIRLMAKIIKIAKAEP